ncbi:MAG: hypothetical protein IMF15_07340 [Proteobacteria bacterium]|nr:hypothetical protein [Pseudomonadota bacterium]
MLRRRRKTDIEPEVVYLEAGDMTESNLRNFLLRISTASALKDYLRFAIYCMLLTVPLYAITMSVLKNDWIMVFVDALIIPVGFVHGLLLLTGYAS